MAVRLIKFEVSMLYDDADPDNEHILNTAKDDPGQIIDRMNDGQLPGNTAIVGDPVEVDDKTVKERLEEWGYDTDDWLPMLLG